MTNSDIALVVFFFLAYVFITGTIIYAFKGYEGERE